MGLLNEQMNGSKPDFGKIDVQNNFSFFEVESGYENALVNGTKGAKFEGRDVSVEAAQQEKKSSRGGGGSPFKKSKKGKRSRRKN